MANSQFLMANKAAQVIRISEKRELITNFLKSETFSTPDILSQVVGMKGQGAHATLKAMVRDGLLRGMDLATGHKMQMIYGLTPHAAALASDFSTGDIVSYFEPGKVSPWTLQHSLSIQKLRLQLESHGWTDWKSDRQCRREAQKESWLKVPDALATNPQGERVALEVERSYKSLKRYPDILSNYLQMIRAGRIQNVHYHCVGAVTAKKMREVFHSIKQIKVQGQYIVLEAKHYNQLQFIDFSTTPKE